MSEYPRDGQRQLGEIGTLADARRGIFRAAVAYADFFIAGI